ncbi:MAG: hydantoinase/oxoprolinase family protein [Alphaproteobacteria bacterium]|nr:hydantoinase/oxoprolinase family protein [Alphaproteobacteria bacterium]
MKRIGIDVGGTNTDAVLVADGRVLGAVKAPTTPDVTAGIVAALHRLRDRVPDSASADAVLIGTTHFVNSVVQRRNLTPVAAIRIGLPATASLPPFCDWPTDLAELVRGGVWAVEGGHDYDGRPFMPLDTAAVRQAGREIRERGLRDVAVTAMFSPLIDTDEETAAAILREEVPGVRITCSHHLGGIGLLERENAALLNAALIPLAEATVRGFATAMAEIGLAAPLYITQNDGTVAEAARAAAVPVYSFASGPTNSMRGAAFLSGLQDAIVADLGGTTADFGHLRRGFPREANAVVHVGGVRTLFRMPDLISIGLGGGSLVDPAGSHGGPVVGPTSVGYRLTEEALVFGGNQLTATDIGVAAGLAEIGDRSRVARLDPALVAGVLARARAMIEEQVDRMKTEAGDVVLLAVGGGAFLVPDRLEGVARVLRVAHGDCANAVGAAIAQVSGEVDQVFRDLSRAEAIARAQALAGERAVEAGADPATLSLVEAEDIPIAYLPGNAMRVRAKVVGDIAAVTEPRR